LDQDGNAWVFGDAWVAGNASVSTSKQISWFSHVGSEDGTLTAYINKNAEIEITRGCFKGNIDEFETAVNKTHGNNKYAKEYLILIQFIRLRFEGMKLETT